MGGPNIPNRLLILLALSLTLFVLECHSRHDFGSSARAPSKYFSCGDLPTDPDPDECPMTVYNRETTRHTAQVERWKRCIRNAGIVSRTAEPIDMEFRFHAESENEYVMIAYIDRPDNVALKKFAMCCAPHVRRMLHVKEFTVCRIDERFKMLDYIRDTFGLSKTVRLKGRLPAGRGIGGGRGSGDTPI